MPATLPAVPDAPLSAELARHLAEVRRLTRALASGPVRRMDADRAAGRQASGEEEQQAARYYANLTYLQLRAHALA